MIDAYVAELPAEVPDLSNVRFRPSYTPQQAREATSAYFQGDELATDTILTKYLLKDNAGVFRESGPDDIHRRMAGEFARMEGKFGGHGAMSETVVYEALKGFKEILPQGSPMYGIGNNYAVVSLSNCVVVESPSDDVSDIFNKGKDLANLFKRRCGVGIDISGLRPEGSPVSNAAGTTTGAWSFADFYSYVCRMIGQNGRRGALMITIDVRHPDVEKFIAMKQDRSKVTGANISLKIRDDFMEAVENDTDFTLRWPVDSPNPTYTKVVRARDVWDLIVKSATESAEPGLMMWDNILKTLPAECYADVGFRTITTNPCFAGDTQIAVADGRNAVPIAQLAAEGLDVPVYSVDPITGLVSIKWARNPRKTGTGKQLLRIVLDDETFVDVTPDHKFWTLDGKECLAKDLTPGTSLPRFSKRLENPDSRTNGNYYYRVRTDTRDPGKDQVYEHRLVARFFHGDTWDELHSEGSASGWHRGGVVVHHKDYDPSNNRFENLEVMTFRDHAKLHASIDTVGEKNGRYSGHTREQIEGHARQLIQTLGRRFSQMEWFDYARENGLPQTFSEWRSQGWYSGALEMGQALAVEMGVEHVNVDPRTVRNYMAALQQGYHAVLIDGQVSVTKRCEYCNAEFSVDYGRRECSYCSQDHSLAKHNANAEMHQRRVGKTRDTYQRRAVDVKTAQAKVYSDLKFALGRDPLQADWETACKNAGVPRRLRSTFGYAKYSDLKAAGATFNHKVARIEYLGGTHDVYNLTVDMNHTVGIVTDVREKDGVPSKQSNLEYHGIFAAQCGEIPLSAFDSCRLIAINLMGFVKNPFTVQAKFDFKAFGKCVRKAMRLSDDLVELELEKLEAILGRVDTEDEAVLWQKLLTAARNGRRTGLGTLALADTLASLGLRYGADDAVAMTDKIYEALAVEAYTESVELAKERGAFPAFDWEKEKDNQFILQLPLALRQSMAKHGRRNISILTNAPTGSMSICAQVSSGIEPVFRNAYTRRKKINHNSVENVKVDYTDDMGDRWQEFTVLHHNVEKYLKEYGGTVDTLPDYFVTSDQIPWKQRINMQAAIQRHIDHSISSTINLPKGTAPEEVSGLYTYAWKMGLKGVTIYVDGSRSGVLVTNKEAKAVLQEGAPKRPTELPCEIHRANVQGEKWTLLVGMLDGQPYEVFGGLSSFIDIPEKYKAGVIIKNPRKSMNARYDLRFGEAGDEITVKNIVKMFENPTHGSLTRFISMCLRHGVSVQYVVEQLQKEDEDSSMFSFSKVVARTLKKHIPEGITQKGKECPQCSAPTLVYQEGCITCTSCGYAKCG